MSNGTRSPVSMGLSSTVGFQRPFLAGRLRVLGIDVGYRSPREESRPPEPLIHPVVGEPLDLDGLQRAEEGDLARVRGRLAPVDHPEGIPVLRLVQGLPEGMRFGSLRQQ